MPLAYFRSWTFDAGMVLLAVGVFATQHGVRALRAAEAAATWHDIDSSSAGGFTFAASVSDPVPVSLWLILGVLPVIAGLATVTFAARLVSRQR
jgi:hypothetical protein